MTGPNDPSKHTSRPTIRWTDWDTLTYKPARLSLVFISLSSWMLDLGARQCRFPTLGISVVQQGLKGYLRQTRRENITSQESPSILVQQTNLDRGGSTFEQIQPQT